MECTNTLDNDRSKTTENPTRAFIYILIMLMWLLLLEQSLMPAYGHLIYKITFAANQIIMMQPKVAKGKWVNIHDVSGCK